MTLGGADAFADTIVEFAPAETIDSFVRPSLIFISILLPINIVWAILIGKVVADILFYTIAALSKKYLVENKGLTSVT